MVRAYISANSARVILAFLLFGSISGFVLGQELHHPFVPAARTASVVMASATGSLGIASPTTPHTVTVVSRTTPHRSAPAKHSPHQHHSGNDDHTVSVSAYSLGPVYVYQNNVHSGDRGNSGNGGHD